MPSSAVGRALRALPTAARFLAEPFVPVTLARFRLRDAPLLAPADFRPLDL